MDLFEKALNDPAAPLFGIVLVLFLIMEGHKIYQFFKARLDNYHGIKSKEEDFHEKVQQMACTSQEHTEALKKIGDALEGINSDLQEIKTEVSELKKADQETYEYRRAREAQDKIKTDLDLSMARVMLLDNYDRCVEAGVYTIEQQSVYHGLYEAYKGAGGNGIMDGIAERIKELPDHK